MRVWWALLGAAMLMTGCGYPGEPLPPALNRPARVADLTVVEHGAKILAGFTLPLQTTEGLPINTPPDIEIRVGPIGDAFLQDAWERDSDRVPPTQFRVANGRVEAEIPAAKYYRRTVVVGVRLHGPKGRNVGWSVEVINILPELPRPEMVVARDAPGGVSLEWRVARPATEFRVFRRLQSDKEWTSVGTSDKTAYLDTGIEYGKVYEYYLQTAEKSGAKYAESEKSDIVSIQPADRFPPAPPTGLTAVPGTKTIELVWDNSVAADFASYRIYRDNILVGDALQAASFSDRDVVAGAKHTYQVTALDTAGNESERSAPVESTLP